ncbi:MAG: hypothetical protein Q8N53_11580 [Longimicrobiales bacterium]|nr:hypothetical protein [Longimicrobiales bacterium]
MSGAEAAGGRAHLRHTLATLAYRAGKALSGAPASFAGFRAGETTRTPLLILAHMGDLMVWALTQARGEERWVEATPGTWEQEVGRFFAGISELDAYLASEEPLGQAEGRLFQGAVADALTHVGQINLLRRMAGAPVRGENYNRADVQAGRVGPDQAPPRREFD